MWKRNLFNKWVLLYVICNMIFGASVPEVVAIEVARNIYREHGDLHGGDEFSIAYVETIKVKGINLIYIFHLDPIGFIMVPAENQAVPNLAFGFDHSFDSSNMPSNLQALMNQYKLELQTIVDNQIEPLYEITQQWNIYINNNFAQKYLLSNKIL